MSDISDMGMYSVRDYNPETDPAMLKAWCAEYSEVAPARENIPVGSSYVLEDSGLPILFISLIRTNASFCYLENYCGDPALKGRRSEAVAHLIAHLETKAKEFGHSSLVTFAYKPKLARAFEAYGFQKTLEGITAFYRGVA